MKGVVQGEDKVFFFVCFVETAYRFDPKNYVTTHDTYSIRERGSQICGCCCVCCMHCGIAQVHVHCAVCGLHVNSTSLPFLRRSRAVQVNLSHLPNRCPLLSLASHLATIAPSPRPLPSLYRTFPAMPAVHPLKTRRLPPNYPLFHTHESPSHTHSSLTSSQHHT